LIIFREALNIGYVIYKINIHGLYKYIKICA
jgi:hypothetical protein